MANDSPQLAPSLTLARRLVARATPEGVDDLTAISAALQRECTHMLGNLRDALGDEGCNALLARALSRAEGGHPALKGIRRLHGDRIHLDGVAASIDTFGASAVVTAIDGLLAALVDVLGRLIGEDMALRLIDAGDRHRINAIPEGARHEQC